MPISRFFVAACLAGAIVGCAASFAGAASLQAQQAPPPIAVKHIGGGLYLITGGSGANAGFYVTAKEVCVIDAKMTPDSARLMLAEIRKITKAPTTTVILTHSDGDHVNGLPGFPDGFVVVAHENVKRDMEKALGETPALRKYLPRVTYAGDTAFDIGGTLLPLRHFGPAHTDGDTAIIFEKEKAAFVGDLAFQGRDPLVHLKKNGSAAGLVKTLRGLLGIRPPIEIFLSGHADPLGRADIETLAASVDEKVAKVKALVAEGKKLDDVKAAFGITEAPAEGGRPRWPSLVEVIYQELTTKK
jgi:glyoxylase-like metal-dependent hydrolase (beta-lactamase superfamily II)